MKKSILVYEDDRELSELCLTLLGGPNRHVEVLHNCDNIISDIEQFKPDLILMDLWIPLMGGEKATAVMKNNRDTKHIPIILFSANPAIEEICKRVKADGYLQKPFDIATLRRVVEENIL